MEFTDDEELSYTDDEELDELIKAVPDERVLTGESPDKIPIEDRPIDYLFQNWGEPDKYFFTKKDSD